jgi:hypothetical protein
MLVPVPSLQTSNDAAALTGEPSVGYSMLGKPVAMAHGASYGSLMYSNDRGLLTPPRSPARAISADGRAGATDGTGSRVVELLSLPLRGTMTVSEMRPAYRDSLWCCC